MDLTGKTALVTGGSRGVGRAISEALAEHGATVVIADLTEYQGAANPIEETVKHIEQTGQDGAFTEMDLSDPESVIAGAEEALDEHGPLDILVNNAGIAGPTKPCEEITVEEWDQTLAVNLRGQFLLCRELLPAMKTQNYGRIVNISSVSGKEPLKHRLPYTVSKIGVIGLTRTLAEEVGEYDINLNAVCPGAVDGPRMQRVIDREAEAEDRSPAEVRAEYESEAARNEMITAEDVASLVAFLCSDAADRITGQDINVDAGLNVY